MSFDNNVIDLRPEIPPRTPKVGNQLQGWSILVVITVGVNVLIHLIVHAQKITLVWAVVLHVGGTMMALTIVVVAFISMRGSQITQELNDYD